MTRAKLFFIPVLLVIDDSDDTEPPPADFDFDTDGESVTETRPLLAGPGIRKVGRLLQLGRAS